LNGHTSSHSGRAAGLRGVLRSGDSARSSVTLREQGDQAGHGPGETYRSRVGLERLRCWRGSPQARKASMTSPAVSFPSVRSSDFTREVKAAVDGYFRDRGLARTGTRATWIKVACMLTLFLGPYAL